MLRYESPKVTGQIVLADSWLPNNIKKEQPQRCGSSMLCVLTADETKAVSKRSGSEDVPDIID
jgi:hypothetical protein